MWELIRLNRRKSILLFILMGGFLMLLGFGIGTYAAPNQGGWVGLGLAVAVWAVWSLVSYFAGDSILLRTSGAREVSPDVHPQLFNVVEEMKIASGLPAMPRVYIIKARAPNAFAMGRKPEKAAVAVTAGLLSQLNRDELQGVIAHEVSHIKNRDIMFMTFAGIMLGSIVLISHIFLRSLWFSGGSSRRYSSSKSGGGGGQAQVIIMLVVIAVAILAPIMAQLLYFAISRKREYLADASAARFTRYPEGLASALEKISNNKLDLSKANKVTAPMYIANPLKKKGKQLSNLSSTHPPLKERIRILRTMSGGANYLQYQAAFADVKGKGSSIIPKSGIEEAAPVPIRKRFSGRAEKRTDSKTRQRNAGDLIRAVNGFAFMLCASCGLKIKTPPDMKKTSFACPRCKKKVKVPTAEMATAAAVLEGLETAKQETKGAAKQPLTYHRKDPGWESFSCSCGKVLQISPVFEGSNITCSQCKKKIRVTS